MATNINGLTTDGLKTLLLCSVGAALVACGSKDETVEAKSVKVPEISSKLLDGSYDVKERNISADAGAAGLAYLGMDEKSEMVTWADRKGDNGTYTFTDVRITSGNTDTVTIEELMFVNLEEVDGVASVGKISADDIVFSATGATLNVDSYVGVNPDLDDFMGAMTGAPTLPTATAMDVQGVSGTMQDDADGGEVTLKRLAYRVKDEGSDGFFFADDMDFEFSEEDWEGKVNTTQISVDDVRVNGLPDAETFMGGFENLMMNAGEASIANPIIKSALIDDFMVKSDTMTISMESFRMANEGDKKVTSVMALAPTRLSFSGAPSDYDLTEMYEGMQALGYDELVLSGSGQTVLDTSTDVMEIQNNYFVIDDMMRMSFDGSITGWVAMETEQKAAAAALGEMPGDDDPDAQFEYMMAQMEQGTVGLDKIKLNDIRFEIEDMSIMERAFKAAAEEQDTTPAKLKGLAKSSLGMGVMMAQGSGLDAGMASDMVSALSDFIDNPESTLVIALDPKTPLGMDSFEDPTTLTKATLGFSASVEK